MGMFVRGITQRNAPSGGQHQSQPPKQGGMMGFAEGVGNMKQGMQQRAEYTGMQNQLGQFQNNVGQATGLGAANQFRNNMQNNVGNGLFNFMQGGQNQGSQNNDYMSKYDDIISKINGSRR